jgi:YD repeat-containing protein
MSILSFSRKKKALVIFLLSVLAGCRNEAVEELGGQRKLYQVKMNDHISSTFAYTTSGLLREQSFHSACQTNPVEEWEYQYQDGRVSSVLTVSRSHLSSIAAMCNPSAGLRDEEKFEYDTEGRISRIVRANSFTTLTYNASGRVEKRTLHQTDRTAQGTILYRYDGRGNLVEEEEDGLVTRYEYDNKVNPFYLMNHRPGWISPWNRSPNNVVRATGRFQFERSIWYDAQGLPVRILEDNGLTYIYEYR